MKIDEIKQTFFDTLDSKELQALQRKALKIFVKKIVSMSRRIQVRQKGISNPYFGAKVRKNGKTGFLYGACQNPVFVDGFTNLPTTARVPSNPHVVYMYGVFRTIKSKLDNRYELESNSIRYTSDNDNDPNVYYYRSPKSGLIFGHNVFNNKSFFVETNWSSVEKFFKYFSDDDLSRLALDSWDEVYIDSMR